MDPHYADDFSNIKEVPHHRLKHRNPNIDEEGNRIENPERQVMIQPNNIEFFYAEEETSERVWRLDFFMDKMYFILSRGMAVGVVVAIFRHFK